MRLQTSPSTGRRYPLTMICTAYRLPRSSVYAAAGWPAGAAPPVKRGPKTVHSDKAIVHDPRHPRGVPLHGEGYRKVRARLAHRGLAVGASGSCA